MKMKAILLYLSCIVLLSSCVIEESEKGSLGTGPYAIYPFYRFNDQMMCDQMGNFTKFLTISDYLNCENDSVRDHVYKPYLGFYDVKKKADNTYVLSLTNVPLYRIETEGSSLSVPGAKWTIYDLSSFIKKDKFEITADANNAWTFKSERIVSPFYMEPTVCSFEYVVKAQLIDISAEKLIRELSVEGKGEWNNSVWMEYSIGQPLLYSQESRDYENEDNEKYFVAQFTDGELSLKCSNKYFPETYSFDAVLKSMGSKITTTIYFDGQKAEFHDRK
ncbi:MAG: hypothetical protein ACRCX5_02440 [Bacteroidales bacterium]